MVPAECSRAILISQDRSLLRTHCNSTVDFMARSLQTIKASQGWLLDQVNGLEASSELVSSEEPEGEPGGPAISRT